MTRKSERGQSLILLHELIVGEKESKKVEKYQDFMRKIGRLWKLQIVEVVPVVIETLESVTKEFDEWIEKLGITNNVGVMQKTALFGTAKIFEESIGDIKKRLFC